MEDEEYLSPAEEDLGDRMSNSTTESGDTIEPVGNQDQGLDHNSNTEVSSVTLAH